MQQYEFMEKRFAELAKYFCIDKKTSMEEVFGDLAHFCKDFEVHVMVVACVGVNLVYMYMYRNENGKCPN